MLKNGIDMIEIERVEKSLQSPAFLNGVFGAKEQAEWKARGGRAESAAGAFAAKEAFAKAMGTGIRGFSLTEVEVLHDALGAPYFHFSGKAKELVRRKNLAFALSITHTKTMAAAYVIAYEKGEK